MKHALGTAALGNAPPTRYDDSTPMHATANTKTPSAFPAAEASRHVRVEKPSPPPSPLGARTAFIPLPAKLPPSVIAPGVAHRVWPRTAHLLCPSKKGRSRLQKQTQTQCAAPAQGSDDGAGRKTQQPRHTGADKAGYRGRLQFVCAQDRPTSFLFGYRHLCRNRGSSRSRKEKKKMPMIREITLPSINISYRSSTTDIFEPKLPRRKEACRGLRVGTHRVPVTSAGVRRAVPRVH